MAEYPMAWATSTTSSFQSLENGSIILLHNGATYTKDALDVMLTELEEQGYSFIRCCRW